jgi:hypothetical protein
VHCIAQVVGEVKIEGGYRKPEWRDLVIVQTALLPYTLLQYAKTYHRRYVSKEVRHDWIALLLLLRSAARIHASVLHALPFVPWRAL